MTPHYTMVQATASETALKQRIDNSPNEEARINILYSMACLEQFHWLVGNITSFYRSPELNTQIGGVPSSYHIKGLAVDFHPTTGYSKEDVVDILKRLCLPFLRKVIIYDEDGLGKIIHVSFHELGASGPTQCYIRRNGKYLSLY